MACCSVPIDSSHSCVRYIGPTGADPGVFAGGGGVNDGHVQRAPAPTGSLGLINIRLRYIASIEYSERFFFDFFFFAS